VSLTAIRRRITRAVGWALAVLLVAAVGRADRTERPTVVVVRPAATDSRLAEALIRIEAELRTAGFDVVVVAKPEDAPAESPIETAAVIGIFGDAASGLEFKIEDHRGGRTVIRKMAPEGETGKRAPEILANYAVELLVASLAELDITPAPVDVEPAPPASPPPPASVAPVASVPGSARPPPPSPPPVALAAKAKSLRLGLESGVGVATSGVGPAVLPVVRVQYALLPAWGFRLTGAGLGTRPEITGPEGTASVSQGIVLLETLARPWRGKWATPKLSLGAGAHYFGVQGQGRAPFEGVSASRWSVALDLGVGVSSRPRSAIELALEAHALLAYPYPRVRFLEEQRATAGHPTFLVTATVAGWL
jgi:hypothetical protein